MRIYLDVLREVLNSSFDRKSRAELDGKKVFARTKFGREMRFDLPEKEFPIVTTKPVSFRMVALELAAFIAATENVNDLLAVKVPIWKGNAESEWWKKHREYRGHLGRIYGVEFRHFPSPWSPTGEVDQIAWIVNMLRTNPDDRRMILTAWNPASVQGNKACLPPCHIMSHFDVIAGRLHLFMYQRSCDMLLGVPFNTASYRLLQELIAQVAGFPSGEFIHYLGDHHIYENHFEAVEEQPERKPLPLPKLWINPEIKEIDDFRLDKMLERIKTEEEFISGRRKPQTIIDDYVRLIDYNHYPKLTHDQRMAV